MFKVRCMLISSLLIIMMVCTSLMAEELTLDNCIELALKHNKDVIRARSQATLANNNVWQAVGDFLPDVSINLGMDETHSPSGTSLSASQAPYESSVYNGDTLLVESFLYVPNNNGYGGISKSYAINGNASMVLFNGGRNIYGYLGAQADKKYNDFIAEATEQEMIYTVKDFYFSYLQSVQREEIAREAVKRGEEQYKLAKSKYEVGSASKSDVLKAQVQFGNDKLGLIEAENTVKTTLANLKYLIGLDIHSNVTISDKYQVRQYDGIQEDALKYGNEHHPGLQALRYNLKAAKSDVKKAWGTFLPTWSISLSKTYSGDTWKSVSELNSDASYWTFSSTINIPIFQGFARKAA
ncbi:MAG: TolC family protein, partial [Candidatus Zixiibacteriota bacterium]